MKYQLSIQANEGYSADQVRTTTTVADLKDMLEDLEDDDVIVTYDLNNSRGASYGKIVATYLEEVDEIDDIEEYIKK